MPNTIAADGTCSTATTEPTETTTEAAAAAGTATRLAGIDPSGTSPNVANRMGATASCAPSVVASTTANGRGRRVNRRCTSGATTRTPAVAAADRSSPTDMASSGSIVISVRTATPSAWTDDVGVPRARATSTAAAMTAARETEGSARVSKTNQPMANATTHRWPRAPSPMAPANSSAPAATTATFDPLTATRWVSPAACMRSSVSSSSRLVSPVTSPTARPAVRSASPADAATRTRCRTRSVDRPMIPGPPAGSHVVGVRATTAWRRRSQPSKPSCSSGRAVVAPRHLDPRTGGASRPRSRTRSPECPTLPIAHHPSVVVAGSVTTVTSTTASPPSRARRASGPVSWTAARASDPNPTPITIATTTAPLDGRNLVTNKTNTAVTAPTSTDERPSSALPACQPLWPATIATNAQATAGTGAGRSPLTR